MDKRYRLVVDEAGPRLDKYVSQRCPELSRARAQRLITDGHIRVNDLPARVGLKLGVGDRVTVTIPPAPPPVRPEAIPLSIVYQDSELLVIDKPAGLTVHPAPGHPAHTLANAVLPYLSDFTGEERPGIVHRLDKDTSGLMVIARNSAVQLNLMSQFRARSVVKAYLALVRGHLTPEDGVIEAPVGRSQRHRQRMAVVAGGREASTRYHVLRYIGDKYTLLEVSPETGRTHQIRVHLKAIGYPVMGDSIYGVKSSHLSRQFLHACRLGFRLPATDKYVEFTSELPPDLAKALKDIG